MYDRKGRLDNGYEPESTKLFCYKVQRDNTIKFKKLIDAVFNAKNASQVKTLQQVILNGQYIYGSYSIRDLFYIHSIDEPEDNGWRLGCFDISDDVKTYMSHRLDKMGHWFRFKVWIQ